MRLFKKENEIQRIILILSLVLFFTVLPLFIIGLYDRPSADDYSFTVETYTAWRAHVGNGQNSFFNILGGIFSVLGAAASRALRLWRDWTGDFTTNFLMSLSPCIWGNKAYLVTPFIMILPLIFSTIYLMGKVATNVIGIEKKYSYLVSLPTLIIIIQCMINPPQGFFWFNGSSKYILLHSVLFCFLGLLIELLTRDSSKFQRILISILGFFVAGGNQVSSLNGTIIIIILWIYLSKTKNEHLKVAKVPFVSFLVAFLLNVLAPGNIKRMDVSTGMNPIKSIFVSLYYYFDYCINEWTTWPVVLLILFLIPIFITINHKNNGDVKFKSPLLIVLLGYCITSATMTPVLFGSGSIEAGRIQNITFITYILTLILSEWYVIGWIMTKVQISKIETLTPFLTVIAVVFVFAYALTFFPNSYEFTTTSAFTDIMNGSAKAYATELDSREKMYISGEKNITVEPLTNHPALLFVNDMEGSDNQWIRDAVCKRFKLETLEYVKDK